MLVKIHDSYRMVVAVCDSDLVGKKIEEREMQLDLTGNFFNGEEKSDDETGEILLDCAKEDATFFIVGKNSCDVAKKIGIVNKKGISEVAGIPFALCLL